jgi:hypothetical protein
MAGMKPEESLPPAAYTDASSRMVYEKTLADAETVLATGQSVILDAAFLALEDREDVRKLALRAGSEFTGIWLHAPRELLCERVSARTGDASDADVSVVERQLERDVGGLEGWTRIDASGTADEVAESLAALELGTP